MLYSSWLYRSPWSRTSHSPRRTFMFEFGVVATQCAAVTTHLQSNRAKELESDNQSLINWFYLVDTNAPPQLSFLLRNPVLMSAACHGCEPNDVEWPPTIRFDRVYNSPQPRTSEQMQSISSTNLSLSATCSPPKIQAENGS